MTVLREEAQVKGAPTQTLELKFTRHGPVIFVDAEKNRAYAVRSAWLEPGMAPYFGQHRLHAREELGAVSRCDESLGRAD